MECIFPYDYVSKIDVLDVESVEDGLKQLRKKYGRDLIEIDYNRDNGKLLSSNMTLVGKKNSRLHLALCSGEYQLTAWDMGRHMVRMGGHGWQEEGCENEKVRSKDFIEALKIYLAERIFLDPDAFGDLKQSHRLDHLFTIERRKTKGNSRVRIHYHHQPSSKKKILRQYLGQNPLYHSSHFWSGIDKEEHRGRINKIIDGIPDYKLPCVYQMVIFDGEGGYPIKEAVEATKSLIKINNLHYLTRNFSISVE